MEKQDLDLKITEAARVIRSYCIARTSSQMEAEDLAQDIILEIYKSAANIRSSEAFYGFMWSVAGNVYRQWAKRKARRKECELVESACEQVWPEDAPEDVGETESDEKNLLRGLIMSAANVIYLNNYIECVRKQNQA